MGLGNRRRPWYRVHYAEQALRAPRPRRAGGNKLQMSTSSTPPRFLYFDLGKVLIDFSVERMLRQMAAASGISVEDVQKAIFEDGLQRAVETGRMCGGEFYEAFRQKTGTAADFD